MAQQENYFAQREREGSGVPEEAAQTNFFATQQGKIDRAPAEAAAGQVAQLFPQDLERIMAPTAEPEDLHGDMMTSLKGIPSGIGESLERYLDPETYTAEALPGDPQTSNPITAGANLLKPALETSGPVAQAGWDTWWNSFGRAFPEGSKAIVEQGYTDLSSGLIERWDAFSNNHPLEAALIGDTGTVAELIGLKGPNLSRAYRKQVATASTKAIEARRQGIYKLIRTKDSDGEVLESSTLSGRREQWSPDRKERDMSTTLETIPEVDPNRSYSYNHNVVDKQVGAWRKQLDKLAGKHHRTRIDKTELLGEFDAAFEDLPSIEGYHTLSTDAAAQFDKLVLEARRLVEQAGTHTQLRPKDLLNIRREFDKLFKESGGSLELSTKNARNVAAGELRTVVNDKLKQVIDDSDVHDLLDRQHEGIKAKKILRTKRDVERNNMFTRTWHKLSEYGHLPRTPLALYATAGVAVGAGAPIAGGIAAAGATVLTAHQMYKALKGPARNRALAAVLAQINKASKKDPTFANEIAAERALIIEMLKEGVDSDDTAE